MQPDKEGFLYPVIDNSVCVECGMCKSVCPLQNQVNIDRLTNPEGESEPLVYAIKHKLDDVRMSSSSGGAYTAISDYVLGNVNIYNEMQKNHMQRNCAGGNSKDSCNSNNESNKYSIVYGAEFNKDFTVHHVGETTKIGRDKFRGSKYVQSDLEDSFIKIKNDLIKGKTVLFTGTPCQTAGLRCYIEKLEKEKTNISVEGNLTDNLILNDIICHGTPSPLLWKEYLGFIQEKQKSKLKSYSFRFKEKGWRDYPSRAVFQNGKSRVNKPDIMVYIKMFFSLLAQRPSCYYCKFANMHRPSDITIGDFWGVKKNLPKFEDSKGISLVLINTSRGRAIFEQIKDSVCWELSNITDCLQHNLIEPNRKPLQREEFWEDYFREGFNYIAPKYGGYSFTGKIRRFIINSLKKLELFSIAQKLLGK